MSVSFQNSARAAISAGLTAVGKCMQENFDKRQSQFKPLAASTIKHRKYLGFDPTPILIASGTLQKHIADEHSDIATSGNITSGTVSPSTTAKPDYGDQPISEYAGALNKVREFWIIQDSDQIERIKQAMMGAFSQEFNRNG